MAYTFDPIFAVDPNNPANVAKSASITIFDPADTTQAPITITDPTGVPLPNPITVDASGMGPAYQHPTLARVGWKGAGFVGYFTSYEGMYNETVAAKAAAQTAASSATTAAGEVVTAAAVNGSGKLILTKATGATVDAGSVIGPVGPKGDKGSDGANVLPTDAAIKQAITTPGTETATALNATYLDKTSGLAKTEAAVTYGPQVSAVQDLIGKIKLGAQNVSALFITDSTGTYDQATWTSGIPAALAALFPTHTISVRTWNYTTGTAWNAATTAATGTGPRTVTLWFGGAPGQNWQYFMDTVRRATFFGAMQADTVFIGLGHNDPAAADVPGLRPNIDRAIHHLERFRLFQPHAAFVLVSQNPTTVAGKFAEGHADAYRRIATQRGYGFIDCTRPFQQYNGPITDLVPDNNLHPTAAGYALWRDRFMAEFVSQNASRPIPQALPSLSVAGKSIIPRVTLPMASNGWALSNVTETSEAVIVDRRTSSAKLTKTAGGSGAQVWQALPNYVRGKSFFAVIHMYIPAASYANAGQVQIREGGTVRATAVLPTSIRDQWFDVVVSWDAPHTAPAFPNGMRLYINVDGQGGAELPTIYVEDVDVFIGDYPLDAVYG